MIFVRIQKKICRKKKLYVRDKWEWNNYHATYNCIFVFLKTSLDEEKALSTSLSLASRVATCSPTELFIASTLFRKSSIWQILWTALLSVPSCLAFEERYSKVYNLSSSLLQSQRYFFFVPWIYYLKLNNLSPMNFSSYPNTSTLESGLFSDGIAFRFEPS